MRARSNTRVLMSLPTTSQGAPPRQSASTIASQLKIWLEYVEAAIGRKPIIYTGKYFWQDNVGASGEFVDYPLWIPNYSAECPDLPNGTWSNWKFFQYTSTGSVGGVTGNVDRDLFNGSYDDLLAFAGGAYAAEFVSQSFPYAADDPLVMTAGETVDAYIEMRNVGSEPWNENTFLATTEPRDRDSVFAGPEWPSPSRVAAVEGEVLPGETFAFVFQLHAPEEPGIYREYFGLVQEGVAWFSDAGQGGPPDDQLQGKFEVIAGPPPEDPEGETEATFRFIRRVKRLHPATEIMLYIYTPLPPSPHIAGSVHAKVTRNAAMLRDQEHRPLQFPRTAEEWSRPEWVTYWSHTDAPWLTDRLRQRIRDFTTVLGCRFPSVIDIRSPPLAKRALRAMSSWRYRFERYDRPWELDLSRRFIRVRDPRASGL